MVPPPKTSPLVLDRLVNFCGEIVPPKSRIPSAVELVIEAPPLVVLPKSLTFGCVKPLGLNGDNWAKLLATVPIVPPVAKAPPPVTMSDAPRTLKP